ncbi:MAG TPA: nitroreductase family protein [Anaerolineaceae bacterium]|nr:nitroreductase family protein [Anaerolineaceae bacterium]
MDVYEAMAARMTIRDFADREISRDLLTKLVAAGFQAPTNNHLREWHFVLLQDRQRRKDLLDQVIKPLDRKGAIGVVNRWGMTDDVQRVMYIEAIPKQYAMLMTAGALIFPCFCQPSPLLKPKDLSALNAFASIWCCIENILVAAAAEGIFGVTRIPFDAERKTIKQFLAIPEPYEVPCYLALGYPQAGAGRAKQVAIPIEERIHAETWG